MFVMLCYVMYGFVHFFIEARSPPLAQAPFPPPPRTAPDQLQHAAPLPHERLQLVQPVLQIVATLPLRLRVYRHLFNPLFDRRIAIAVPILRKLNHQLLDLDLRRF